MFVVVKVVVRRKLLVKSVSFKTSSYTTRLSGRGFDFRLGLLTVTQSTVVLMQKE